MRSLCQSVLWLIAIGASVWPTALRAEITLEAKGDLFIATVTNVANVEFVVPDNSKFPVNPERIASYYNEVCKTPVLPQAACDTLETAIKTGSKIKAEDLGVKFEFKKTILHLNAPLYTLREWFNRYKEDKKTINLMVNGNWFNINWVKIDGRQALSPGYPYKMPVTTAVGYSVSNGRVVTKAESRDPTNGCFFDALLVTGEKGHQKIQAVRHQDIPQLAEVKFAVSGIMIVEEGKYVKPVEAAAACNNTPRKIARTAVGLTDDGKLIAIVKQPGRKDSDKNGWTDEELAQELIKMGVSRAINLDNSGSSQFLYTSDGVEFVASKEGDALPQGMENAGALVYRPVPNFFGIIDSSK